METGGNSVGGAGSSITVTTKIIRSESPLLQIPGDSNHGLPFSEARLQGQLHSAAVSTAKFGRRFQPAPIRQTEDDHDETCPSPVVHDRRMMYSFSLVRPQSGFEESPEWRQHYEPSSKIYTGEGPYLRDHSSRLQSDPSSMNSKNFSSETLITAKVLPERKSVDTIELGSRTLLCLRRPASRVNLLKVGNARLKQLLIGPKSKTHSRSAPVAEGHSATVGQLPQLDSAASSKDRVRRSQRRIRAKSAKSAVLGPQWAIKSQESCASIVDLNQVEARHGLEKHHRNALSKSWDEIFKSMGGFSAGTAHIGDGTQHGSHPAVTALNAIKSDLSPLPTPPSKYGLSESPPQQPKESSPSPGPRTSSSTAIVNAGRLRRNVQIMAAELPAQSPPQYRSKSKPTNQADSYTEMDMQSILVEESVQPRLQDIRSLEGLSSSVPGPDASQSTIALEAIEAELSELYSGLPLYPSMSNQSTQPFSINCTPPQPVTAPTDPPIGPLPELPEELERPDAGSRASSHNSSTKRASRPPVPPRAPHRRSPSSNSGSSRLTVRAISPYQGHQRRQTCVSTRCSKKATSIRSSQSQEDASVSSRPSAQTQSVVPMSDNAYVTGFNAFNLGNSHALRSPAASEISQENGSSVATADTRSKVSIITHGVLLSRTEHIKELKLRDLAKEKATRTRNRHLPSHLDDVIVMEDTALPPRDETGVQTSHLSHDFTIPQKLSGPSEAVRSSDSRPASRQESVKRRPSYQSPQSPSGKISHRTLRPILGQSQIMVLAETDPETQNFRAATPTGSLQRSESKKADSFDLGKERKLRKRNSKSSLRPRVYGKTALGGLPELKHNGEHTPPHSDPSTHSSDGDDDMAGPSGTKRHRSVKHIAALVNEGSDVKLAPPKHALVALAHEEEKKYLTEQLHLRRLRRESSELKLAMRLLSRGLEKLTTFVEAGEEEGNAGRRGLIDTEMEPVRGVAESFGRVLGPDDRKEGSDIGSVPGKRGSWHGGPGLLRVRSAKANDSRPISLLSRYSSVRNNVGESVVGGGPAIREEVIWDQVDGLNRAAGMGSKGFVSCDY